MDSKERTFWLVGTLLAIGVGYTAGASYTREIGLFAFAAAGLVVVFVFLRLPRTKFVARKIVQAVKDGVRSDQTILDLPDPPKIRRNLVVLFWDIDRDIFLPCDAQRMFWNSAAFSFTASVRPINPAQEDCPASVGNGVIRR